MKLKSILATLVVTFALASAFAQPTTYSSKSQGFNITSPVTMVAAAPETQTDAGGKSMTINTASGQNHNGVYMLMVVDYTFPLTNLDLETSVNIILQASGTELVSKNSLTVDSYPATYLIINVDGVRAIDLLVIRGDRLYQILFGSEVGKPVDTEEVNAYFKSFELT